VTWLVQHGIVSRTDFTARYIQLVEELGRQMQHKYGWRRRAAEKLGVNQPTLSKIMRGERTVGWELAERAVERLGLDPSYFSTLASTGPAKLTGTQRDRAALDALIARFDARVATTKDVYALARAVAEAPAVVQARAILKTRQPRTEQQVGALFLAASKLIELLRASD
jgi:transcriptional regulator with XRE-family HTH domain